MYTFYVDYYDQRKVYTLLYLYRKSYHTARIQPMEFVQEDILRKIQESLHITSITLLHQAPQIFL